MWFDDSKCVTIRFAIFEACLYFLRKRVLARRIDYASPRFATSGIAGNDTEIYHVTILSRRRIGSKT